MAKVKKLKLFSFSVFQGFLFSLVGLLCGIVYSLGGFFIDVLVSLGFLSPQVMSTPGLSYGTLFAFGALVGMPIIFGLVGFVMGMIESVLYNSIVFWFGSPEIKFFKKQ